jgi:hypothetical protein
MLAPVRLQVKAPTPRSSIGGAVIEEQESALHVEIDIDQIVDEVACSDLGRLIQREGVQNAPVVLSRYRRPPFRGVHFRFLRTVVIEIGVRELEPSGVQTGKQPKELARL